jgi:hypothetical protein
MRLERFLDKRIQVRDNEAEFSVEARERIYQRPTINKEAIPAGVIRQIPPGSDGKPNYSISNVDGSTEFLNEDEIGSGLEVVDARLLGVEGSRYDSVFSELRTAAATARFDRIHSRAKRIKAVAAVVGLTAVAFFAGVSLQEPTIKFTDNESCVGFNGVREGQTLERVVYPSPYITQPTCELAGQKYFITDPIAK